MQLVFNNESPIKKAHLMPTVVPMYVTAIRPEQCVIN